MTDLETSLGMGAAMASRDVWPPCPIPHGCAGIGDELHVENWMPYSKTFVGKCRVHMKSMLLERVGNDLQDHKYVLVRLFDNAWKR